MACSIGAPRSGTSLLAQILNTHPQVACFHEYGIGALIGNVSRLINFDLANKLSYEASGSALDDFTLNRIKLASQYTRGEAYITPRPEHVKDIIKSIYKVVSGKKHLKVFADKTPNWVYFERELRSARIWLGELKIILVVRRPCDVIRSSLRRAHMSKHALDKWRISTIEEAILEWKDNWEHLVSESNAAGRNINVVKYEDLISNFEATSHQIAKFPWG